MRIDAARRKHVAIGEVRPTDPSDGLTPDNIRAIQATVAAGKWRENIQANVWAGYAIAQALGWGQLNKDDDAGKTRAKAVLQKVIKDGFLQVVPGQDERRKPTNLVVVGKPVESWPDEVEQNQ